MTDTIQTHDESVDVDALRRDNEALRLRIAELETLHARQQEELLKVRERLHVLDALGK